jgi:elongation factor P
MSTVEATGIKRGMRIELDGDPYLVLDVHFQSPSARGTSLLIKVKVRNLRTDQVMEKSFRGADRVQEPDFEMRPVQFLYRQGDEFHFMDRESYDQFAVAADALGDSVSYLTEGLECRSMRHNGKLLGIELPHIVELRVVETEPVIPGATAKAQAKPAVLETGGVIQVPAYLEADEIVRVDTREGRFVERVRR